MKVTPAQALQAIRGYARAGRIVIAGHAVERMRQRNVRYHDVRSCLTRALSCDPEPKDRWKVSGPDTDGDGLVCVVVLESGVVVVTMY